MPALQSFDSFLSAASRACLTPIAIVVQIQGCMICLVLAVGWARAAYVRNREIRQMKEEMRRGNSFAFLCRDINDLEHSNQVNLPRVTITSLYGGPVEFLFIVESTEDPAYHAISRLLKDFQDDVDAKIIVAGYSTTCSQKIHNQLVGAENMHKDSKYILFLDDDIRLHPGTIGALTAEMEKNPEIFIQTGYPLDLPSGSLGSYCIYEYHMYCFINDKIFAVLQPCSMGFATGGKTFFLWGGCMMMHADDFRRDNYGVVSGLRDGGYSDDMTLAAIAGAHKKLITSPLVAVFTHPLASDLSFSRYWNYLRKQTFVLESYISEVNWIMNRALFSSHCYLSWGFVAPYFMGVIHVAAALRFHLKEHPVEEETITSGSLLLVGCLAICTAIELPSMWNLTRIEVHLCKLLSPEAYPLSLASYNCYLVFLAMLVDNFYTPSLRCVLISHKLLIGPLPALLITLYSFTRPGEILPLEIDRGKDIGPLYTDLSGKHVSGKRGLPPKTSFISSLARSIDQWRQPKKYDV
ncbi:hypothetical protein Cgig2_024036 [Carnegiea gigantea]|uniref:ceramide glucosyltransferase n=1 Tax=Carnegiea gigantea TaxID=171969 RepID=A0A9Q1KJN2_9CARY|nr:hypothetical protein Cgig2_024036 [Carnegiea gigantea]